MALIPFFFSLKPLPQTNQVFPDRITSDYSFSLLKIISSLGEGNKYLVDPFTQDLIGETWLSILFMNSCRSIFQGSQKNRHKSGITPKAKYNLRFKIPENLTALPE